MYLIQGETMQTTPFKIILSLLLLSQSTWIALHFSYLFSFNNSDSIMHSSLLILGYSILYVSMIGLLYSKKIFRVPLLLIVSIFLFINCLPERIYFTRLDMGWVQLICGFYGAVLTLSFWGNIDWKQSKSLYKR